MAYRYPRWQQINPHKCSDCDGLGMKVHEVPCDLYKKGGMIPEAYTCPTCLGSGRKPPTVADVKLAAAGGER